MSSDRTNTRNGRRAGCWTCGEDGHVAAKCATWKTRPCWLWNTGKCPHDEASCQFAHGPAQLRRPGADPTMVV